MANHKRMLYVPMITWYSTLFCFDFSIQVAIQPIKTAHSDRIPPLLNPRQRQFVGRDLGAFHLISSRIVIKE